jgi:acetyl esterase/lipase
MVSLYGKLSVFPLCQGFYGLLFLGMGGDFLSSFYIDGRTPGGKLPMPFNAPFFPTPFPELDSKYDTKDVCASTLAGYDANGMPLSERQAMFFYPLQRGNYLDYLTGIPGLSAKLASAIDSGNDVAEHIAAGSAIPNEARPLIPQLMIDASFPPTFFIHGKTDTVVSIEESRFTARQLNQLGIENVELEIPDGEHGFENGAKAEDGDAMFEQIKSVEAWLQAKFK